MAIVFANNASGTLATNINAAQTTITLEPGAGMVFPNIPDGSWSPLVLFNNMGELEIMHATHKAGDTFTVTRGRKAPPRVHSMPAIRCITGSRRRPWRRSRAG